MPAETAAKPATRRPSNTRSARLATSARHGAVWVLVWRLAVEWRAQTWPIVHTAADAVTAMYGSVI